MSSNRRLLVILVLAVAVGAGLVVIALNERARQDYRSVLLLTRIGSLANEQTALEFEAIAAQSPVLLDVPVRLANLRRETEDTLALLGAADRPATVAVEAVYRQYTAILDEEFSLLTVGRISEARRLNVDRGADAFAALRAEVQKESARMQSRASLIGATSNAGSIAALAVAGAVMTLLILRLSQARLELTTVEQDALRQSERRTRSLIQNSSDVITVVRSDLSIQYQSASATRVLGRPPQETAGAQVTDWIHPDDRPATVALLRALIEKRAGDALVEFRVRHGDGSWRFTETAVVGLVDDPNVRGLVLNTRDISERKALEQQLAHQAFHDGLTQLANRALFQQNLERSLERRGTSQVAVLFLDLDGFKLVNDGLGHEVGDQLLVLVADRLRNAVRSSDLVARFGGDEFVVLLEDATPCSAEQAAQRLMSALQVPFKLSGREVYARASLGVALGGEDAQSADALLRNADVAMYMAKARGKNRFEFFEAAMRAASIERLEFEAEFVRALDSDELVLHYQPVISCAAGALVGFEALVRWQHPRRGLLQPAQFIGLAEETGMIRRLDQWVMRQACRQLSEWQKISPAQAGLEIGINLSAKQFQDPLLAVAVSDALAATGVDPGSVSMELTESALVDDVVATIDRMNELKALGVRLAIDDFGTGYSSLAYLLRFPVDTLKIDKAFVSSMTPDSREARLADAIAQLGHRLGLRVVAEGVETAWQLQFLKEGGCDLVQGYALSRPVTAEAATALVRGSLDRDVSSAVGGLVDQLGVRVGLERLRTEPKGHGDAVQPDIVGEGLELAEPSDGLQLVQPHDGVAEAVGLS